MYIPSYVRHDTDNGEFKHDNFSKNKDDIAEVTKGIDTTAVHDIVLVNDNNKDDIDEILEGIDSNKSHNDCSDNNDFEIDDPVDIIATNEMNEEKIISDSCSTNSNTLNEHSSIETDVLVCDINGNNKNNNKEDDTNTISNCIVKSNNPDSENFNTFCDVLTTTSDYFENSINDNAPSDVSAYADLKSSNTLCIFSINTSVYFNDAIDDNAPSDVSVYVPVKNDYNAID